MTDDFKEYYFQEFPELNDWGNNGEIIEDVFQRFFYSASKFLAYKHKEALDCIENSYDDMMQRLS